MISLMREGTTLSPQSWLALAHLHDDLNGEPGPGALLTILAKANAALAAAPKDRHDDAPLASLVASLLANYAASGQILDSRSLRRETLRAVFPRVVITDIFSEGRDLVVDLCGGSGGTQGPQPIRRADGLPQAAATANAAHERRGAGGRGNRTRLRAEMFARYMREGRVCQPNGTEISGEPKLVCPLCRAPHSVRQHNAYAVEGPHPCDGGLLLPSSLCADIAQWAQAKMRDGQLGPQDLDVRSSARMRRLLREHGIRTEEATGRAPWDIPSAPRRDHRASGRAHSDSESI